MHQVVKLITFDSLHTLVQPRLPIYLQYSQEFKPFLGELAPEGIKAAFTTALRNLQEERPVYKGPASSDYEGWWAEVIRRTALGAEIESSLHILVPRLLHRFSSKEGYKLFDDVLPTLRELTDRGIPMAIVSNADSRMRSVLRDLDISHFFRAILLSEEIGIEKPDRQIFMRTIDLVYASTQRNPAKPSECLHIGDEFYRDYQGARGAGMESLLLRRPDYDYADEVGEGVTPPLLTSLEALPQLLDDTTLGES